MWVDWIRSIFEVGALSVLMVVVAAVMAKLTSFATSGPNADHETVSQLSIMFEAMTVENLTLIVAIGGGLTLLWLATLESNV